MRWAESVARGLYDVFRTFLANLRRKKYPRVQRCVWHFVAYCPGERLAVGPRLHNHFALYSFSYFYDDRALLLLPNRTQLFSRVSDLVYSKIWDGICKLLSWKWFFPHTLYKWLHFLFLILCSCYGIRVEATNSPNEFTAIGWLRMYRSGIWDTLDRSCH